MSEGLTTASLRTGFGKIIEHIETVADELNRADGAIGDGDLGVTMVRGTRSLKDDLPNLPEDLGMAFMKCAQAFTRVSGSTLGTLLATGLMAAARKTKGRTEVAWSETGDLVAEAVAGMSKRSQAQLGDKTILDALNSVGKSVTGQSDPGAMIEQANQAVDEALNQFRDQLCKVGRARIFGEKTIGRDDPGMLALKRMLEALVP